MEQTVELVGDRDSDTDDQNLAPILYREMSMDGCQACIFDVDDSRSYYNWRLVMSTPKHKVKHVPPPRFRELIDPETNLVAFQVTGDPDGSVSMVCPPLEDQAMAEEFPVINLIMTDLDAYSSVEIFVVTISPASIEKGKYNTQIKTIKIMNFRSRKKITDLVLEMPMRLRPSWNYASLDLEKVVKEAWNDSYLVTKGVKVNANIRLRHIYFTDKVYKREDLPKEFQLNISTTVLELVEFLQPRNNLSKLVSKGSRASDTSNNKVKLKLLEPVPCHAVDGKSKRNTDEERIRRLTLTLPNDDSIFQRLCCTLPTSITGEETCATWEYPKHRRGESLQTPPMPLSNALRENKECTASEENKNEEEEENEKIIPNVNEPSRFCAYIWGERSSGEPIVEFDEIEQFDVKPQTLVKAHKQRQAEGFYDIYKASMIIPELTGPAVIHQDLDNPPHFLIENDDLMNNELRKSFTKNKSLETFILKPKVQNQRTSLAEPDTDWSYLNQVGGKVGYIYGQDTKCMENADAVEINNVQEEYNDEAEEEMELSPEVIVDDDKCKDFGDKLRSIELENKLKESLEKAICFLKMRGFSLANVAETSSLAKAEIDQCSGPENFVRSEDANFNEPEEEEEDENEEEIGEIAEENFFQQTTTLQTDNADNEENPNNFEEADHDRSIYLEKGLADSLEKAVCFLQTRSFQKESINK